VRRRRWERLSALLDSALADNEQAIETWRVWINAYGEAVRLPELRHTIEARLRLWYEMIDHALEGLVDADDPQSIPWSWRLDAVLNGLAIQALTSEAALDSVRIRDEVIRTLFPSHTVDATGTVGRGRKRARQLTGA
jgi:hypothetical protein